MKAQVTGICYPCATILYAAVQAKKVGGLTKVGKTGGIWYCVQVF